MTDEDLLAIIRSYTAQMEDYGDVDETRRRVEEAVEGVTERLNEIRAEAWDEGAESAFYDPEIRGLVDYPENPYRSNKK